jgi:uncharacterized membrane protein YciS (DUF1049 family)
MILSLVLGIILGAISVIFVLQNVTIVTVAFLSWQFTGSLTIVCGILMTLLLLLPGLLRDYFYLSAIRKRVRELENDLANTKQALANALPRTGDATIVTEQRIISS